MILLYALSATQEKKNSFRLELENKIGVDQEHAAKGEDDLRMIQDAKAAQDTYITRCAI